MSDSNDDGFDAIAAGDERERRIIEKVDRFEEVYKRATAELGVPPHIGEYERLSAVMRLELHDLPPDRSYEVIKSSIRELRPIFEVFPECFDHTRAALSIRLPGQDFQAGAVDGKKFSDIKKEHDAIASPQDCLKDVLDERNARTEQHLENERTKRTHERKRAFTEDEIEEAKNTDVQIQRLLQPQKASVRGYRAYSSDYNLALYTHYHSRILAIADGQRRPTSAGEEVELVKKNVKDYGKEVLKEAFDRQFDKARSELGLPPKGQKSDERKAEYAQFVSSFMSLNKFIDGYKQRMANKKEEGVGQTVVKQVSKVFRS